MSWLHAEQGSNRINNGIMYDIFYMSFVSNKTFTGSTHNSDSHLICKHSTVACCMLLYSASSAKWGNALSVCLMPQAYGPAPIR